MSLETGWQPVSRTIARHGMDMANAPDIFGEPFYSLTSRR